MNDRRTARPAQPTPLFSEQSERAVIGVCLTDITIFWSAFGRLKPSHFTIPRLARVWDAMCRCGDSKKPVNRNYVALMIRDDAEETTPLPIFLNVLINDAPNGGDISADIDTVLSLANKRSLLDALERAKRDVLGIDVGVPVGHMQDAAMRAISTAIEEDFDSDMRTYHEWGHSQAAKVKVAMERDEDSVGIGLSSKFGAVNDVIGRALPGKLIILAGMASAGKSALARQISEHYAEQAFRENLGFGYSASLEMQGEEHAARYLSERLGIPSDDIEHGNLNPAQAEAIYRQVEHMKNYPIIVDTRARLDMKTIRDRMIKVRNTRGLAFAVIDHLLLVKGGKNETSTERVADASIEAKNLAKEFGIPVLLLAQLNEKTIMDRPSGWPNASDLFGGQAIQQNADVTAFVHRPEIITRRREPPKTSSDDDNETDGNGKPKVSKYQRWLDRCEAETGVAWIFNDKRRGGARGVKREMTFQGTTMSFSDKA